MEISLENFRCHISANFEFPLEGLVSISGGSGTGKSTILSAIVYALYGKIPGKNKKPYTLNGKKTSKVTLLYPVVTENDPDGKTDALTITRTSRPNNLIVEQCDVEYEDDSGQGIIDSIVGTFEEFMAACYIVQRSNASVLSMTPMEQVRFVEVLANTGPSVEKYKIMIKTNVKETKSLILKKQGEIEGLNVQLEEKRNCKPDKPETPECIAKGIEPKQIRKELGQLEKKMEEIQSKSKKIQLNLEKSRNQEKENYQIRKNIEKLDNEIKILEKMAQKEIPSERSDLTKTKEKLKSTKKQLVELKNKHTFYKELENFQNASTEYCKFREEKMALLEKDVLDDASLQDLEKNCEEISVAAASFDSRKKTFVALKMQKESARKKIGSIFKRVRNSFEAPLEIKTPTKMIEFLNEQLAYFSKCVSKIYNCPCCNSQVAIKDDILIEAKDSDIIEGAGESISNIKSIILEIQEEMPDFDIKLDDPGDIRPDPSITTKAFLKAKRIRDEFDILKDAVLSSTLIKMKDRLEKRKLGDLDASATEILKIIEIDQDKLQLVVKNLEDQLKEMERVLTEYEKLHSEISKKTSEVKILELALPKDYDSSKIKSLENSLSNYNQELCSITGLITEKREVLDSLTDYETYQNYLAELKHVKIKIKKENVKLDSLNNKLEGLYGLEEISKEAEILALEETVKSINEHAKIYLDQMFEDPILVRLCCVKERSGKKDFKLQMNTTIDYKGNTYNDIEELSGGERQRCDIAFLLAIGDMIGSKLLMLDECLNNLDSTINTEILSFIRELCGGKLIIVISHEAVKGLFEHEILVG